MVRPSLAACMTPRLPLPAADPLPYLTGPLVLPRLLPDPIVACSLPQPRLHACRALGNPSPYPASRLEMAVVVGSGGDGGEDVV